MQRISPLVSDSFTMPTEFLSDHCVLHLLTVHDVIRNYKEHLGQMIRQWLAQDWPFRRIEYPDREV